MKTKKITLVGGFHNASPITIRVDESYHPATHSIQEVLSESQARKLSRHFCGIKGCTCGSYYRATEM